MSCSVHVQFPAGKPVTVSVNGVAIARDAIQREMQHHPAEKPIAAWQQAARALVIRELLLQRAKHLSLVPEPMSDEAGRRETDDEALMRAVVEREVTVPTPDDATCRRYYEAALPLLPKVRVMVALGRIAHDNALRTAGLRLADYPFAHCAEHRLPDGRILLDSYHCSRYNQNTGRLTPGMFEAVFARALELR